MKSMIRETTSLLAFGATMAIVPATGCEVAKPSLASTVEATGTLRMSLTGTGKSGNQYRLRNATFNVTGTTNGSFSSEEYLDAATAEMPLQIGNYSVELADGWMLERLSSTGAQAVEATLISENPQAFIIRDQEITRIAFQFEAGGGIIQIGEGTLELAIEVTERSALKLEPGAAILVGNQPTNENNAITSGDVNGDGWPDLALAHGFATGGIVLNQQSATLAPEVLISESWWNTASYIGASSVSLADLDLDGNLDYVFSIYGDHYVGQMVQLYKGDGNGHHAIPSQLSKGLVYELTGANPMGNQVADFDHNGLPDIVIGSNNGSHTADLILQTSSWAFTAKYAYNQNWQSNPQWIETADLNNDGWADLVVPFLYGTVDVYLNTANGTGAMTYAGGYLSAYHSRVSVGDFNGDGFVDIAAHSQYEDHVDVLYNNGSGRFLKSQSFIVSGPGGTSAGGMMRAGDLNGDGAVDLVACSTSASTIDVLLGDGQGSFREVIPFALDEPPYTLALDDFDLDGDLDVAVYTSNPNVTDHVRILWNRTRDM